MAGKLQRGFDKSKEKRMWSVRAALELGMELNTYVEHFSRNLSGLDQSSIWRGTGKAKTCLLKCLSKVVVELISVSVALADLLLPIAS